MRADKPEGGTYQTMVTERKETKQMQSTFEKLGGTYKQVGDYLLPEIEVPENPVRIILLWCPGS